MIEFAIENNQKQIKEDLLKKSNRISTTLYSIYSFLPKGLWNQLKQITNVYFLFIAILNVIPFATTVDPYSAFLPVIFVIVYSLLFDYADDIQRYFNDRKINNAKVEVIRNGKQMKIRSKKIQIGDLLMIQEDKRIEADVVLMTYKSPNNQCFIDTSTLDGEKSLKNKDSVLEPFIQKSSFLDDSKFIKKLQIEYQENSEDIDHFEGHIQLEFYDDQNIREIRLDKRNFMPKSCKLKNTTEAIGLVVYVGKDTKVSKNTQKRIFKKSSLYKRMQYYIVFVLSLLLVFTITLLIVKIVYFGSFDFQSEVLKDEVSQGFIGVQTFFGYILLMNTLLPISLIVTQQLLNLMQNAIFKVQTKSMYKTEVRINTTHINEEMGQIQYILSDKTGTLTQNKMIPKYFLIQNHQVDLKKEDSDKEKQSKVFSNQLMDNNAYSRKNSYLPNFQDVNLRSVDGQENYDIEDQNHLNKMFLYLVNSCHDCFSLSSSTENDNHEDNNYENLKTNLEYQGSSPDEIALLQGSRDYCNILMKGADREKIVLLDKQEGNLEIQKIYDFPFDSFRKRMSNIVKIKGKYFMVMKGADSAVLQVCRDGLTETQKEYFEFYLEEGYRVMLMAIKLMSQNEVNEFLEKLRELERGPDRDDDKIYELKKDMEQNMTLLGVSAIEDKLQKNLKETIDLLKLAKIKIWVITGDKVETAVNIAYSSGLFNKNFYPPIYLTEDIFEDIRHEESMFRGKKKKGWKLLKKDTLNKKVLKMKKRVEEKNQELYAHQIESQQLNNNLVVSNKVLQLVLKEKQYRYYLSKYIQQYDCVVFAQTNPTQKVEIVKLLQDSGKKVLAIGDGANDVNMIQKANVGVGIMGQEGQQAKNSADYAINQFQDLKLLVLSFGRKSYYRNSQFILQFFYKNILFTMPQFYYAFFCDISRQNTWNDWYMASFNLIFTATNVTCLAVTNYDLPMHIPKGKFRFILHSMVYYQGQDERLFNFKKFGGWILVGALEALALIWFYQIILADNIISDEFNPSYDYYSVSFLVTIVVYLNLKLILITYAYNFWTFLGIGLSILSYFLYIVFSDHSRTYGYFQALSITLEQKIFWFHLSFTSGFLLVVTLTYYTLKRYIFFDMKYCIRKLRREPLNMRRFIIELNQARRKATKKNFRNFLFHQLIQILLNIFNK